MRKYVRLAAVLLALALLLPGCGRRQAEETDGLSFVKKLGNGINLGNCLDCRGAGEEKDNPTAEDYETYWGNPAISETLLKAVKKAGFGMVRIPVSWGEHMDEAGAVDPLWMERVEEVVRQALDAGLTVILDTHHEAWLDLAGDEETMTRRFSALWQQIALRFAACGEGLLFEGLNEPRMSGSKYEWTGGTTALRQRVDRLNRVFAETVRAAGGSNEKRWLIVAPYCDRADAAALKDLQLPDSRCIAAVHVYAPDSFCLQEPGTRSWGAADAGAQSLRTAMGDIREQLTQRGIPVIITECGCLDKDNEADRAAWVRSLREEAEACGAPCIWWDNGREFRLLDRETGEVLFPELLKALTEN